MSAPREVPRRRKRVNYRGLAKVTAGLVGYTFLFTGALYQVGYLDGLFRRWPVDPRDPRLIAERQMMDERRAKFMEGIASASTVSASRTYEKEAAKEKLGNTEGMKKLFTSEGFDETKMKSGLYGDVVVSKSERLETVAPTGKEKATDN